MKKIVSTDLFTQVYGIRAYLDDVEHILLFLKERGFEIEIADSNNIYDDINELIKIKGTTNLNLIIKGKKKDGLFYSETIDLEFTGAKITIYARGSNTMRSLGFEIKDYFNEKVVWHYWVFWVFVYLICPIFAIVINILIITNSTIPIIKFHKLFFSILGLFSWLPIWFSSPLKKSIYGLTLTRKHEYGFWRKNKDQIIVGVLTTLLGAILGVIGTLIAQHYSK